jgi:signal transduction histidine kinase
MSVEPNQVLFWIRTLFFVGSLLPVLYFFFAYSYVRQDIPRGWKQFLLFLPNAVLFWIAYNTPFLVRSAGESWSLPVFGPGRIFFAIHFVILTIAGLVLLGAASRRQPELDRKHLLSIVAGTIVSFNIVFVAMYGSELTTLAESFWVGNVALMIGVFIIALSIIRHRLFVDLRLVSIEVFVIVALFVVIADIAVARSTVDFSLRLVTLIVLIFYGIVTSRTIMREIRHVRELQILNEQVTAMNAKLIEADRSKTRFVSIASHQFRAPLAGIRGYLDMLNRGDFGELTAAQRPIIVSNLVAANQLLETIETFLDATKIELGKFELYRSETNLREVIERAVSSIKPLAGTKKLMLEVDVPLTLPMIVCDGGKIYHVLMNLIDNAVKYTVTGGITISAAATSKHIEVRVKDSGAGLSDADKRGLFEMFQRGTSGIKVNKDGSGIGLFIVKNIIQAHGGEILVESPGKGLGSTFGFTLPFEL